MRIYGVTSEPEREMLLMKVRLDEDGLEDARTAVDDFGARVLDDRVDFYTVELTGISEYVDEFVKRMAAAGETIAVVRSGAMAVSRGKHVLGSDKS